MSKDVQLFSLVVQLFKNMYMRTTEFVQLWKKTVHFGRNSIVNEIKSQRQCTKNVQHFLWLYSFLMVVQLFKNIHKTTEFVQVWTEMYILVQTPLSMKLRAKDSVPKMYSFFLWLYSFLMVVHLFNGCTSF